MLKGIYLDNSMTTRPSDRAVAKMMPFFADKWGVPSMPHQKGQELYPAMEEALGEIYRLVGAKERDQFVFTSSGVEAVNHVLFAAYFDVTMQSGRHHYICAAHEEAAPMMAIARLEELSCSGKRLNPDRSGKITAEMVTHAMTPRTALVSLSWANGMTGVIHPAAEIAAVCKERGVAFHLDISHALGKLYFTPEELGASYLTFGGDLIHAPKGTGGLFIKEGVRCSPFIVGGIEQGGKRAGNYSIGALAALGEAAKEALLARDFIGIEGARLRNRLEEGIKQGFPDAFVFYEEEERLPHVSAMAFPGVVNEALLYALNKRGVYASIGGGNFQQLALILNAAGIERHLANTALSFSLSRETTEEEIDRAVAIIVETAKKLRTLSEKMVKP